MVVTHNLGQARPHSPTGSRLLLMGDLIEVGPTGRRVRGCRAGGKRANTSRGVRLRRSCAVAGAGGHAAALATSCWDSTLEAATNHVDVVQSQAPLSINKNPNLKVEVAAPIEDANATVVVVVSVQNKDNRFRAVVGADLREAQGCLREGRRPRTRLEGTHESLTHFPSLLPAAEHAYFVDDPFPPGPGRRTPPSRFSAVRFPASGIRPPDDHRDLQGGHDRRSEAA